MCRGFRSVNIVLTLYFESLETLDFTVFYSYVNGSNPLTHANLRSWKPLKINGFRLLFCFQVCVKTCDLL